MMTKPTRFLNFRVTGACSRCSDHGH